VATTPFDPIVATQAINTHTPFVLTDQGPLGTALRSIGAMYLPQLADALKAKNAKISRFSLKRLFVKQA
jgi:hypothetical protein